MFKIFQFCVLYCCAPILTFSTVPHFLFPHFSRIPNVRFNATCHKLQLTRYDAGKERSSRGYQSLEDQQVCPGWRQCSEHCHHYETKGQ